MPLLRSFTGLQDVILSVEDLFEIDRSRPGDPKRAQAFCLQSPHLVIQTMATL
jgi:hypothetical protein